MRLLAALVPVAYLVNSASVRAVRRGGNPNDGSNVGLRCVNANNAPSNGNWNYGGAQNLTQSSAHPLLRFPCAESQKVSQVTAHPFPRFQKWEPKSIRLERLSRSFSKRREDKKNFMP